MTYRLITVTAKGYSVHSTFDAPDLATACKAHLTAWSEKKTPHALVLRLPSGKRHSCNDSRNAIAA